MSKTLATGCPPAASQVRIAPRFTRYLAYRRTLMRSKPIWIDKMPTRSAAWSHSIQTAAGQLSDVEQTDKAPSPDLLDMAGNMVGMKMGVS